MYTVQHYSLYPSMNCWLRLHPLHPFGVGYDLMGYNLAKPFLRAQLEEDLKRFMWLYEHPCVLIGVSGETVWHCCVCVFAASIGFVRVSPLKMVSLWCVQEGTWLWGSFILAGGRHTVLSCTIHVCTSDFCSYLPSCRTEHCNQVPGCVPQYSR